MGETTKVGVYRLNVAPGQVLPTHYHQTMREAELVLSPNLSLISPDEERVLAVGEQIAWPKGYVHGYKNTGEHMASLLCIDSPPFIPDDERVVQL